ncbi:MAG TPA: putative Ig domain-containing protein, partial [Verrucomicrobiae bacterium]
MTTVSFVPPTICDCDGFKEFCLGGDVAFEFGEIGEKISDIIAKACPPTIKVQGVDVEINISGEICTCCKDGNISLRGQAEGSASITVTLRGGLSVSGDLEFEAPGFTGIKAEADAMIGIELVVKGTVSLIFEQECLGKRRLCVGGSLSLTPFAGTKAMVDVQASSEYDALSWGGRCEMNVGVVGNIEAGIFGCSDTGFRAYGCGELGSLCNMSCALTAVDAFGNTLTNGFNGNADYPWINRSCSTSGPPPVVVSGPVRGPRGPRDPLPDLGTVFEDLPGDIFFKPEAEVMRKLGWNEAAMSGVCAQVKLRIDQEAVISRDAFKATLEVVNDSGSLLNNVSVDVVVQDANGANQTALFGLRPPVLTGISAVNGSGVIGPNSTGKAEWIIVPTSDAAPNEPLAYWVSGTLRYVQDGLEISVPLAPAPITVYPNPRLFVKYFHERNVYSDDPFTDVVEPSIPYNLAVMIENRGKGDARNVRITSAQPEIVDNERGLLIAFAIIATEVAGQNMTPSLTANFGTITNGQIAIGRWLLTSTLQGLFTDYKASFEHLDSLGNTRLSLIEEVTIHEMIHLVRAQGALDDGKFDFLVNAVPDAEDLPDRIFLSDGTTNDVEVVQQANVAAPPSAQNLAVQLTAPMPPGWVYLRVPDPGAGQFILKRVVRSDGREIFFNTNAWTTDRTFIGFGRRPVYEHLFHLLDHDSTGVYTLHYELPPAPDSTPPVSSVAALPTDSRETFQVQWSGSDDTGDVAGYDVFVSANGGPFLPWLTRTKLTTASFQGVFGTQYAFYSVAVDAAGNREAAPITPDAVTTVTLINHPPVITPVGMRTVDEGGEFVLTPVVTDANLPDDLLVFSLVSGPPGLTLNPTTGEMRWLTSEAHGPSTNTITWRVRDSGVPQKSATDTFTLIVNEVNTAPTMGRLTNVTVMEGRWLNVTNTALDTDLPPQKLTWSLGAGAPAGVAINAASGLLTWKPTEFQGGTTNPITVIVRDNGSGSLAATQTFLVTVLDTMSDFFVGFGTTN